MGNCLFDRSKSNSNEVKYNQSLWSLQSQRRQANNKIQNPKNQNQEEANQNQEEDFKKRNKKVVIVQKNESHQEIIENIEMIQNSEAEYSNKQIIQALKNNFLFKNLENSEYDNLIKNMFFCRIKQNEFVFKQGDNATCFFIIIQGQLDVIINGEVKKQLWDWNTFGELALLYNVSRSASIKAQVDTICLGLKRDIFQNVLRNINQQEKQQILYDLAHIDFLWSLNESQRNALSNFIFKLNFSKQQIIVNKGDQADSFYFIKSGKVSCYNGEQFIWFLNSGDSFGEQALFQNGIRALTVVAEEDTECYSLSKESLEQVFGTSLQSLINNNLSKWIFLNNNTYKGLQLIELTKILNQIQYRTFFEDFILEQKNRQQNKIYLILKGSLVYQETNYQQNSVFDNNFLYGQENLLVSDIIVKANSTIGYIEIEKIKEIFKQRSIYQMYQKNIKEKQYLAELQENNKNKIHDRLQFENFQAIKKLGQGQFGVVNLVFNKRQEKKLLFALKTVNKKTIGEYNIQENIDNEKTVLNMLNHPFLIYNYEFYDNNIGIHFLGDYIQGIDMYEMLYQMDLLSESDSWFYIAQLIIALEYLHSQQIIYRDLKPENIMVTTDGYIKLIDMGTSKILKDSNKTYTLIGTPHYMAPEVIQGWGYSYQADCWALGILMFEFQCGYLPYGENTDDPFSVYWSILEDQQQYPEFFLEDQFATSRSLMDMLLNKNPSLRNTEDFTQIKCHEFFKDFDWLDILTKKYKAPYVPQQQMTEKSLSLSIRNVQNQNNMQIEQFLDKEFQEEREK